MKKPAPFAYLFITLIFLMGVTISPIQAEKQNPLLFGKSIWQQSVTLAASRNNKKFSEYEFESWHVGPTSDGEKYIPRKKDDYSIEIFNAKSMKTTTNLKARMQADAKRIRVAKIVNMQRVKNFNVFTSAIRFKTAKGKTRYYVYFVFPTNNGSQVVRFTYANKRVFSRYNGIVSTIQQKIMNPKSYQINLAKQKKVELLKQEKEAKQEKLKQARWTKPNQGVAFSQIEAVYQYLEIALAGIGNAIPIYTNYLLLKDGTVYTKLTIPPSDFNIKVSRSMEPERWSKWSKSWGGKYQIRNKKTGRWEDIKGKLVKPGGRNMRIHENLHHLKVSGNVFYGGGQSRKYINLRKNGRFESSRMTIMTSGMAGQNIASSTAWSKQDKHGKTSSATSAGSGAVLRSRSSSKNNGGDFTGKYSISGYTIEFVSDSGKINRQLFFFDGKDYINIGNVTFSRKNS